MSILIGELEFEGPFLDFDILSDEPGIFAVLVKNENDFELVEMDDAEQVREHLFTHPQRSSWYEISDEVVVAVHYTSDISHDERREIKQTIEREFEVDPIAI